MNPTLSLPACPEIIDVVVDMQNDFVTGALGTPEAAAIADAEIGRASCRERV